MRQEDEIRHYDSLVSKVQPELIRKLPETLQTNDALFLLVLFREDGYLDMDFRPLMKKEDDEINQTLYAYIASALCAALKIRKGKWVIFEKFRPLNNGAQLASNFKTAYRDNCCARRPAFVRSSTPTTSKSSRRSDLHLLYITIIQFSSLFPSP